MNHITLYLRDGQSFNHIAQGYYTEGESIRAACSRIQQCWEKDHGPSMIVSVKVYDTHGITVASPLS